jgi:hypothetical protein
MDQYPRDDAAGDAEDYGYDLAHEVPSGPDQRGPHRGRLPFAQRPPREADAFTDYGSDEAHDL